ncbi:MAG: hypothetical protein ACW98F_11030 [Candidatus Hodarchaeales archaeon]
MESFDYDEMIEIGIHSALLLQITEDPSWGETLVITQMTRTNTKVSPSGIKLPLNEVSKFYFKEILEFIEKHRGGTLRQNFYRWVNQPVTPKKKVDTPTPNIVINQNHDSSNQPLSIPGDIQKVNHRNDVTNISTVKNQRQVQTLVQHEPKYDPMKHFSPERLTEKVSGYDFSLADLVHAIITNQTFSQRMEVSDDQIKVVLFHAFMGRKMITIQIQKEIMRTNIFYNYMQTGRMLREMADLGLVELEERVAKKSKYHYFLWKFTNQK